MHIDAYARITALGGFAIRPGALGADAQSSPGGPKLFFANVGGYAAEVFAELHAYSFHVAPDKRTAWAAAKAGAPPYLQRHQDNLDPVDDIVCVDDALVAQRRRLIFEFTGEPDRVDIVARYIKLD